MLSVVSKNYLHSSKMSKTHSTSGLAASISVEREDDVLGEVGRILDRLRKSEILQILDGQIIEGG